MKVKSGENFTLTCDVTGFPPARIYWTLESHRILEDNNHLQMLDTSVRNSGVYICNAHNDIGIAQKVYYVTVTGEFCSILNECYIEYFQNHQGLPHTSRTLHYLQIRQRI